MSYVTNPTLVKRWWLSTCEITPNDVAFLVGLDIRVNVERPSQAFYTSAGQRFNVSGSAKIEFMTTTEKQETMLRLKYGTDVLLVTQELVV